jgi:hypothetical protein
MHKTPHSTWTRKRLSEIALKNAEVKRKLKAIVTKPVTKTGENLPAQKKDSAVKSTLRAVAEMIRAGFSAKTPVQARPQDTPVQLDEHAVAPVVATPKYPTADSIVRSSLYAPSDPASNLRELIECFDDQPHTGWKHHGKE